MSYEFSVLHYNGYVLYLLNEQTYLMSINEKLHAFDHAAMMWVLR